MAQANSEFFNAVKMAMGRIDKGSTGTLEGKPPNGTSQTLRKPKSSDNPALDIPGKPNIANSFLDINTGNITREKEYAIAYNTWLGGEGEETSNDQQNQQEQPQKTKEALGLEIYNQNLDIYNQTISKTVEAMVQRGHNLVLDASNKVSPEIAENLIEKLKNIQDSECPPPTQEELFQQSAPTSAVTENILETSKSKDNNINQLDIAFDNAKLKRDTGVIGKDHLSCLRKLYIEGGALKIFIGRVREELTKEESVNITGFKVEEGQELKKASSHQILDTMTGIIALADKLKKGTYSEGERETIQKELDSLISLTNKKKNNILRYKIDGKGSPVCVSENNSLAKKLISLAGESGFNISAYRPNASSFGIFMERVTEGASKYITILKGGDKEGANKIISDLIKEGREKYKVELEQVEAFLAESFGIDDKDVLDELDNLEALTEDNGRKLIWLVKASIVHQSNVANGVFPSAAMHLGGKGGQEDISYIYLSKEGNKRIKEYIEKNNKEDEFIKLKASDLCSSKASNYLSKSTKCSDLVKNNNLSPDDTVYIWKESLKVTGQSSTDGSTKLTGRVVNAGDESSPLSYVANKVMGQLSGFQEILDPKNTNKRKKVIEVLKNRGLVKEADIFEERTEDGLRSVEDANKALSVLSELLSAAEANKLFSSEDRNDKKVGEDIINSLFDESGGEDGHLHELVHFYKEGISASYDRTKLSEKMVRLWRAGDIKTKVTKNSYGEMQVTFVSSKDEKEELFGISFEGISGGVGSTGSVSTAYLRVNNKTIMKNRRPTSKS
jgi:hypothetical protein